MGQRWTSDPGLGGTGPGTRASARGKGGWRATEGGQSTRPQQSGTSLLAVVEPTQTKQHVLVAPWDPAREPRGDAIRPGDKGLCAAPDPPPSPRTRRGVPGPYPGCRGRGAKDHGAHERAPGGTRKRRAPPRGALGLRCASGARAPAGPGVRRLGGRSRHPGRGPCAGDYARRPGRGRERAGGRQRLAPEGPSEVGAAGRALGSGQGKEAGEPARAGPRAPAAQKPGRAAPPPSLPGPGGAAVAARWGPGARALGAREGRRAEAVAGGGWRVWRPCWRVCRGGRVRAPAPTPASGGGCCRPPHTSGLQCRVAPGVSLLFLLFEKRDL